jgi:predicted lipoprotein with Yx(FWY)xxD motif
VRRFLLLLAALTATAMVVSACDDDGGGGDTTTDEVTDEFTDDLTDEDTGLDDTTGTGEPPVEGSATVQVEADEDVLVNAEGFTLYVFDNDTGTTSACTGGCLDTWPPLTVAAEPIAGEGVDGTLLNTAEQADGTIQVTYNDHLLYTFSGDTAPGDTNGDGIGGVWHVIDAAGNPVT